MLYLDLPRPKKFGDSRRRHHLYSPKGGAAGAMDCFTPHAGHAFVENRRGSYDLETDVPYVSRLALAFAELALVM